MGAHPLALLGHGQEGSPGVVAVRGEIDVASAPALRDWVVSASEDGTRPVVVDLTAVDFLAVSGVYVLCDEQARMARHRIRLTVACRRPEIIKLLAICRLDDVLEVVSERSEASTAAWDGADEARSRRLLAWRERYDRAAKATEAR